MIFIRVIRAIRGRFMGRSFSRCGEMADAQDLKSWARKGVRVQVPPPAPKDAKE